MANGKKLGRPRSPDGRGEAVTVRIKADLTKGIARYARRAKLSRSAAIRELITRGLAMPSD